MGPFSNAIFSSKELFDENSLEDLSLMDSENRLVYVYDKVKDNMENIFSEFYSSIENIDSTIDNFNDTQLNEYKVKQKQDFIESKVIL